MRPLILKMTAFGPYAGTETVDFRPALDSGLFGIYGATGAGKSSIFSAMTFALFGEAAKGDQHARTLRSDHAEAGTLTTVELIFEVGGKRYRAVRQPDQMRPAKRGGGETEEKHKAWLFELGAIDPDAAGPDNPGKPIAETKVNVVNDTVKELLGYEAAQFRQIVLLPQGRFETFLNSKTDERVAILRDLFDVSLYRKLTERMKERAKHIRAEVTRERAVADGRLKSEGFETLEALSEGIADAELARQGAADAQSKAEAEAKQAEATFNAAAQTDEKFKEYAAAEAADKALKARAATHDAERERVRLAHLAQQLMPLANDVARAQKTLTAATEDKSAADTKHRAAVEARDAAAKALADLTTKSEAIEKKRANLGQLTRYLQTLDSTEALRKTYQDAKKSAETADEEFKAAETALANSRQTVERLTSRIQAAKATEAQRTTLKLKANETETRYKASQAFETAQSALAAATKQRTEAAELSAAATRALETANAAFATTSAALLASHALHLAAHLKAGEPCPVCGATDHPAPASGTGEDDQIAQRYRKAEAALKSAQNDATAADNAFARADERVAQCEAALAGLARPDTSTAQLKAELDVIQSDLAALGDSIDVGRLEADLAEAETARTEAQARHAAAGDARNTARETLGQATANLNAALAQIPEDLRNADVLRHRIDALSREIEAHATAFETTRENKQAAETAVATAKTELDLAGIAVGKATEALGQARDTLSEKLVSNRLTEASFTAAQADIERIEDLDSSIRKFAADHAAATDRLARAKAAIAETDRPDITALQAARDAASALLKEKVNLTAQATARLEHLQKLHAEITDTLATLDRREKESGPLLDLASQFSGDNAARTDLETFAIAAMFDQVLAAANLRLEPMTRGRFRLVRTVEGRGNARRGLDILVEDSFTGSQRPTSTLSGGETFIAALALALGLSDVVEATRGNVRLDAIFIDEGFGSLDASEDSGTLDQVLQSLMDLVGKRRAVGLISHVPLVQQTVQNGFWVTSTPHGSRIEQRG
jgi:exonuclease SbcC